MICPHKCRPARSPRGASDGWQAVEQARVSKLRAAPKALSSAGKDVGGFPFLASLAEREEMVRCARSKHSPASALCALSTHAVVPCVPPHLSSPIETSSHHHRTRCGTGN